MATTTRRLRAPTLGEVARRVVTDYLGTRSGEKFLLITDEAVAAALAKAILEAARAAGSDPAHIRIATR